MSNDEATNWLQTAQAKFVTDKDGVRWWKLPNGEWVAQRWFRGGQVELRKLPANACGC